MKRRELLAGLSAASITSALPGAFNANDMFLKNGMLGVMCNIQRKGHGYRATVDVGVEKA